VLIPQEQHPDINFVGLLIGPRGNTLKAMEKDTGAKIIIRGKGSVKEGKVGRKDGQPLPGEDEPLHAFITAPNPEAVRKAVDKIKDVIRQGIEVPEGHNDLRRMQLRELAQLNGTLRENDIQRCTCGSTDHKAWQCPDKPIITNTIVCTSCGGTGHLTKDCRNKRPGSGAPGMACEDSQAKIDEEYMSLMAELGEGLRLQQRLPRLTRRQTVVPSCTGLAIASSIKSPPKCRPSSRHLALRREITSATWADGERRRTITAWAWSTAWDWTSTVTVWQRWITAWALAWSTLWPMCRHRRAPKRRPRCRHR